MKANKAVKRLAKIEALMSDVTERYSARAPHIREMLQDAKAAVTRAKEALSLQASSVTAKSPPVKHSKPPSKATP
jgi:predicted  nucleic acid-binding Zn-ribbon protein